MTLILPGSDGAVTATPLDGTMRLDAALAQGSYDPAAFRAGTAAPEKGTADAHLNTMTLADDNKCAQPKGFWERLGEAFSNATVNDSYVEGGFVPPPEALKPTEPVCKGEAPLKPEGAAAAGPAVEATGKPADPPQAGGNDGTATPAVRLGDISTVPATGPGADDAGASGAGGGKDSPVVRLGDTSAAPPAVAPEQGKEPSPLVVRLGDLSSTEGATLGTGQHSQDQPAKPAPGQDMLNPLLSGVLSNIGKPVQELEPGINPRLGCVRMVAHAMHVADPSFPETNNAAAFRRALKEHGYEEVTVKPGDPALSGSHAGDVLVGHRPDGMPSHAAINMGDGTVFNNNSNTGKGQIDGMDQFNQGMHDSQGHWMKNGFADVTIYRKKASS